MKSFLTLTMVLGMSFATTASAQPSNAAITQLFAFACDLITNVCPDGESPNSLVQSADGNFYGTTPEGGSGNQDFGTVFKITPNGQLTTVYRFVADQNGHFLKGIDPNGLVEGNDGFLYGTALGGANGVGVVFKLSRAGAIQILHNFCSPTNCGDGQYPHGLVLGRDGNIYGASAGVIWRMTAKGSLTVLHSFNTTVEGPGMLGMTQASDGNFYGTTTGAQTIITTVFRLTPTGQFTILHAFHYPEFAYGPPIQASNGKLYIGLVQGSILESSLSGSDAKEFPSGFSDGLSYLTQGSDAKLWILMPAESRDFANGAVIKFSPNGKPLHTIPFDGTNGSVPDAGLIQNSDGRFFGVTMLGGSVSQSDVARGVVFTLDAGLAPPKAVVVSFDPSHGKVGAHIMIHGGHFVGTTAVTFNGVRAVFQVLNTGNIQATVPEGATTGPIAVTNAGGTTASKKNFTVQ